MSDPQWIEQFLHDTEAKIAEHGYAVITTHNEVTAWAYTVGVQSSYGHPELVVFGLPSQVAVQLLGDIVVNAANGERPWPCHGDTLSGLLQDGYELRCLGVDARVALVSEYFNVAVARLAEPSELEVVQVVFPAEDHSWPDTDTDSLPLLGPVWWKTPPPLTLP